MKNELFDRISVRRYIFQFFLFIFFFNQFEFETKSVIFIDYYMRSFEYVIARYVIHITFAYVPYFAFGI